MIPIPIRLTRKPQRTPWVTWSVILLCVLVFVYQAIQPTWAYRQIVEAYALVPARFTLMLSHGAIEPGVIATIFTSMFMHFGVLHLLGNLWFLHIFGDSVEDQLGSSRYAALFVASGVAGALMQIAVDPYSPVPMVGASGAIAGALAAHVVLQPRARVLTIVPLVFFFPIVELPSLLLVALWFGLQFMAGLTSLGLESHGGIAYWAHIGGFAAGLVLALLLRHPKRPPAREDWRWAEADGPR